MTVRGAPRRSLGTRSDLAIERNGIEADAVDDVIWGCVNQISDQSANVGHRWAHRRGLARNHSRNHRRPACGSTSKRSSSLRKRCGRTLRRRHRRWGRIDESGADSVPRERPASPMGRWCASAINAIRSIKVWAPRRSRVDGDLDRLTLDEFALRSHQLSIEAAAAGAFDDQIVAYPAGESTLRRDEGVRPETSLEKLGALRPAFTDDGVVTAGNSSQISDGAAALLIMSEEAARRTAEHRLRSSTAVTVVGDDPVVMLTAPIPATQRVLKRAGLAIEDIDAFEVNEAFASVVWHGIARPRPISTGSIHWRCHRGGTSARRVGRNPDDSLIHHMRRTVCVTGCRRCVKPAAWPMPP